MNTILIREIQYADNPAIAKVIRDVLEELGVPKVGTAYADPFLDTLSTVYQNDKAVYFVAEQEGKIIGGAGIAQLEHEDRPICELQKMYLLAEARGMGVASRLMADCLEKAKAFGYTSCYLETMPYMEAAQQLYRNSGFVYLEAPLGNTGHYSCPVWMLREL